MTLVPSHQRLLSGNKFLILLLILTGLSSCELFKKTTKTAGDPDIPVYKPIEETNPNQNTNNQPAPIIVYEEPTYQQPVETTSESHSQHYGNYNIGLMLPFKAYSPVNPDGSFASDVNRSLQFYEGFLLGLDELNAKGHSLNVYVYDTENNSAKVSSILARPEINSLDLIIGPIFNKNIKRVSEYGRLNDVALVNPLSPKMNLASDNQKFIQLNPSIQTHCSGLYNYITTQFRPKQVIVIGGGSANEVSLVNYISSLASGGGENYTNVIQIIGSQIDNINQYLTDFEENYVIVASLDRNHIDRVLNKLAAESSVKYGAGKKITLFGMPSWFDLESLDYSKMVELNGHISTEYYVDEFNYDFTSVKEKYRSKYNAPATEYVIKGYDSAIFFADALKQNGTEFINDINTVQSNTVHARFNIQPTYKRSMVGSSSNINYFENKSIHILKFEEGGIIKVN